MIIAIKVYIIAKDQASLSYVCVDLIGVGIIVRKYIHMVVNFIDSCSSLFHK